jgi:hypothetical protein
LGDYAIDPPRGPLPRCIGLRGIGFRAYCVRHARLLAGSRRRGNRISEVHDVDLRWSAPQGDATGLLAGG